MKLKLGLMSPVGTCGGLWGEVGPSATPTAAAASGTFTSAGPGAKVQWTNSTWEHILSGRARSELMYPLQEITHFTAIPLETERYETENNVILYAAKVNYLLSENVGYRTAMWLLRHGTTHACQLYTPREQNKACSHLVNVGYPFWYSVLKCTCNNIQYCWQRTESGVKRGQKNPVLLCPLVQ